MHLELAFKNIGGFPTVRTKIKENIIRHGLIKWDFDVFGFAEMNIDWRLVDEDSKLPLHTREWLEHQHISWAQNRTFPPRTYGSTALFSINKAAHRVTSKGQDETGLGRWCWTKYQGRGGHALRIIIAYRPNPPGGPYTVYAQQNTYFQSIKKNICPRTSFLIDLEVEIKSFISEGDHIILLIDSNSNMKRSDIQGILHQLTLREAIMEPHGYHGPETFRRNNARNPIDGIWTTPGISISRGGYFQHDEVFLNTDHRCLWVDISYEQAFSHNMPTLFKPKARKLHCRDPRLVNN